MKDFIEVVAIVDKSGSMGAIKDDAIGGLNEFIANLNDGKNVFTLTFFNDTVETFCVADNAPVLSSENYKAAGMTAMFDAIGETIDAVGRRLSDTPESQRPRKVIVAIVTDGQENASHNPKYCSAKQISEMITHQKSVYNWEFVFLAANQSAVLSAGAIGIEPKDAFDYQATGAGVRRGYETLTTTVQAYAKQDK